MQRPAALGLLAVMLASACGPVTTGPTPTPVATASDAPHASSPAPTLAPAMPDHQVVYFARDRLPPVAAHADGAGQGASAEARILSRLGALYAAQAPAGLFNVVPATKARPRAVTVDGDLASVDFDVPGGDWGTAGSSGTRAFLQQLVYTISEEPAIRRVLLLENGGPAVVGGEGLVIDHAVARDDVLGYAVRPSTTAVSLRDDRTTQLAVSAKLSLEDDVRALTRLVVTADGASAKDVLGFTASVGANDERVTPELGKWVLVVDVPRSKATSASGVTLVDRTPVRAMRTAVRGDGLRFEIGLDDLRPWRVALAYEPLRLVVDMGGDPQATSANIALYAPVFGTAVRAGDAVSGLVRAFEGRFEYRVRDARGNVVVNDYATASLGTSELWGAFAVSLPAMPSGSATIEIVLRSPRDGSISESVSTSVEVSPTSRAAP